MPKRGAAKQRFRGRTPAKASIDAPAYEHDANAEMLRIKCVPKGEDQPIYVNCSRFLALPRCAISFASALSRYASHHRRGTTEARVEHLVNGFILFVVRRGAAPDLTVRDIDTPLINQFIAFLSERNLDGSFVLSPYTRVHRLGALKGTLSELRALGELVSIDCEVQPNPWPLATRARTRDREHGAVSKDQLFALFRCCRGRIAEIMIEVYGLWNEEDEEVLQSADSKRRGIRTAIRKSLISRAKARFGCGLPERRALKNIDPELFYEIEKYGYKRVARAFGPYGSDLCPFVYYLLFTTAFNLQPLVDIRADRVITVENLGRRVISVRSVKHRAMSSARPNGKLVRATYTLGEDHLSPASVFQFLLRWTAYLREKSTSPHRAALFLFIPRNRSDAQTLDTYAQEGRRLSNFQRHATVFCRIEGFPWVGARQIRDFAAELGHELFRGDVVATGELLQHSRVETTREHYQNAGVRARQDTDFALAMLCRQRWFDSDGKIEPRSVPVEHDRSAATPGFRCLNPMNSPMPGQEAGRMCDAYGMCPRCPFAMINRYSPYTAARLVELRRAMARYRQNYGPEAFRVRWKECYRALVHVWLPAIPSSVWDRAARLLLPPLLELE